LNPNESKLSRDRADPDNDFDANTACRKNEIISLKHLYGLLGPTVALSLTSAALYLISYIYYASFFQRLALPYKGLDIPVALYLPDIIFLLCVLILIFLIYRVTVYCLSPYLSKGVIVDIGLNTILILIIAIILFSKIWSTIMISISLTSLFSIILLNKIIELALYNIYSKFFMILISVAISILIGYLTEKFYNYIMSSIRTPSVKLEITKIFNFISELNLFSLLGFFIIAIFLSYYMGQYNAEELIEGNRDEMQMTIITDAKNIEINNKSFTLMMIRDGNYYLLDRKNSTIKNASMYIIPSNRILFAKTNGVIT